MVHDCLSSDCLPSTINPGRALVEQVFSRGASPPLKGGNRICVLGPAEGKATGVAGAAAPHHSRAWCIVASVIENPLKRSLRLAVHVAPHQNVQKVFPEVSAKGTPAQ
jgi:hypothetical protein